MFDSKLIYIFFISGIDFYKYINKLLDKDFKRFYQSHIGIHI